MEIGLSLGTNMGNRLALLTETKKRISAVPGLTIIDQSPIYETEPVNVPPEFSHLHFLNAVLIIETGMSVSQIIRILQRIEREMGRTRDKTRNHPRLMDIDIIYAGQLCIKERDVTIPHPKWVYRRFAVQPLRDVRPDLHIPGQPGTVSDVLSLLTDSSKVTIFADEW